MLHCVLGSVWDRVTRGVSPCIIILIQQTLSAWVGVREHLGARWSKSSFLSGMQLWTASSVCSPQIDCDVCDHCLLCPHHTAVSTCEAFSIGVCLHVCLCVGARLRVCLCVGARLRVCLCVRLSVCLCVRASACLSVRLSVCLSVCACVCVSVCVWVRLCVCLCVGAFVS